MNHLVVGLGGTGGKSIRALRKLIFAEHRLAAKSGPSIDFLYIDSSREMMSQTDPSWKVLGKSVQLPAASQLQITGEDLSSVLDNINNRYLSAKLSACDAVRGNKLNINCLLLMAQ